MRESLQSHVNKLDFEDRFDFIGGVVLDQLLDFYQKAYILVFATATEGWPEAIVEAMSFGLI